MFNIPEEESVRRQKKERIFEYWRAIRGYNALKCIEYGFTPNKEYEKYIPDFQRMNKSYSITDIKNLYLEACDYKNDKTIEIGETSFRTFNEKFIYLREWYKEDIELPFEDTTIICPKDYDKVLTKAYGDWRTPVFNSSVHEMEYVDPDLPFADYLSNL